MKSPSVILLTMVLACTAAGEREARGDRQATGPRVLGPPFEALNRLTFADEGSTATQRIESDHLFVALAGGAGKYSGACLEAHENLDVSGYSRLVVDLATSTTRPAFHIKIETKDPAGDGQYKIWNRSPGSTERQQIDADLQGVPSNHQAILKALRRVCFAIDEKDYRDGERSISLRVYRVAFE